MNRIIIAIVIGLVLGLVSCTQDVAPTEVDYNISVVEAYLEPGKNIEVKLTRMVPFTEDEFTESLTINSALVTIRYNEKDYLLSPKENKPGLYEAIDPDLIVGYNETYQLFYEYNQLSISAKTTIPPQPVNIALSSNTLYIDPNVVGPGATVDPITVSWDNPDNVYHLVLVEYLESTYDPISGNINSDNYDDYRRVSTDPVLENSYDLNTRQQLVFFGSYRVLVYRVNKEYVDLYENVGQSSQNLTEPLTNVENGLGIFTGMSADTLYLEVKEI